ncbi:hypothetical protein NLT75_002050, partial [Escherichia coli]|nr:hypothetical protein [Escherichia coli]EJK7936225.1 hypothetical protein [Escherichia coli]EJK9299286.1 hypothetical protein [Escherichia coli]
ILLLTFLLFVMVIDIAVSVVLGKYIDGINTMLYRIAISSEFSFSERCANNNDVATAENAPTPETQVPNMVKKGIVINWYLVSPFKPIPL